MRLIALYGKPLETVVGTILNNNTNINLLTYFDEERIERALEKPIANYYNVGSKLICLQTDRLHQIPWNKIRFVRLS